MTNRSLEISCGNITALFSPTYILKVITKSLTSSHPVNLSLICWSWKLLGCNWQISGPLDLAPYTDEVHLSGKRCVMTLSCLILSCSVSHSTLRAFVFMARRSEDASNGHYLTRGLRAEALLAFPRYISFVQAVCALEENLLTCPNSNAADGSNGPPYSEWWDCRMLSWGAVSIASY